MNTETENFDKKMHWENVYSEKQSTEVSWYQQHPEQSFNLIQTTGVKKQASIIDIGGGASMLIDYLLDAGYKNLSVLDISHHAIQQAKSRLGDDARMVKWIELDILKLNTDQSFSVWHDRAVFHFLTDEKDRKHYIDVMKHALDIGSFIIFATFSDEGPKQCSGLDVMHYNPEKLSAVLGSSFQLLDSFTEKHVTPSGVEQSFIYCRYIRV